MPFGCVPFSEAIEAVFPKTAVQLCIVHLVRHSLNYVSWKRRHEVAADLKRIYQSATSTSSDKFFRMPCLRSRTKCSLSRWERGSLKMRSGKTYLTDY